MQSEFVNIMEELNNLHNSETTDDSYNHVLKYTGIFGGVQGLKLLVSLLRNKLTTYILGSVGLGLISVYNSISEFIVSCSNFGIPLNTTRVMGELFEDGEESQISHMVGVIRTWVIWTAILAVALSALLSPVLSYFFFEHDWGRVLEIFLVCPIVILLLVAEGECSILKGLRQLRKIAIIETVVAVSTLLTTIPFYYFWGMHGIIVALIISTAISAIVHLFFSVRLIPYRIRPFSMEVYREGLPMIRKGIPYVLAGIGGSGVAMAIPALIMMHGTLSDVGYYRAGYALMVAYAGIVFVALEADYFPRLSSVNHDIARMNVAINKQIDVCVLLVAPFLIALILCMPLALQILFQPEFLVVKDMAVCASFYMFFRAIMLPIAYTPLAKGDSMFYLLVELLYDVVFGILIWFFYNKLGLLGTGIALSVSALADLIFVLIMYGKRYGCHLDIHTIKLCVFQLLCLSVGVIVCLQDNDYIKYGVGVIVLLLSVWRSCQLLRNTKKDLK